MKLPARHKIYLLLGALLLVAHLFVAALAKPSYTLTMIGDAFPCALLLLAILSVRENSQNNSGILPQFWKLIAAGLVFVSLSQIYWFYFDTMRLYASPSPVPGDTFFLLAHVFFLLAFTLRPHILFSGRDLRIRRLDFALLALWWFALYAYFAIPWQLFGQDFAKYNPAYYLLSFIQHLVIVAVLVVLTLKHSDEWRRFYACFLLAFILIGAGNLLLSVEIDRGNYYSGSFYDTPFLVAVYCFSVVAALSSSYQPTKSASPDWEYRQNRWTARIAMLGILSMPIIAFFGFYEKGVSPEIVAFRLRMVFGAMFVLGILVFWKINLLARELVHLVQLTQASVENLKSVQARLAHSQKLSALGRLAAGAAHEISNPLTAILGYSELLADIPSLTPDDRRQAEAIQRQVHHAQAAVNSLRDSLRDPSAGDRIGAAKPGTS
jgi:signal transduction histidine kinase